MILNKYLELTFKLLFLLLLKLQVMKLHTDVTMASTLWQVVLFSILTEGNSG